MDDVLVIEDPAAAAVALDPVRAQLLAELGGDSASATGLAAKLGISRQKVNYHLRTLETHGLVELAGERQHGGITERVLQATAASYVVSPAAIASGAADPDQVRDRLSARYLVALASRTVTEVGRLVVRAGRAKRRLPTMTIDTVIGFDSAADRASFADELTEAVVALAAKYHHDDGRKHRLIIASYPKPPDTARTTKPKENP